MTEKLKSDLLCIVPDDDGTEIDIATAKPPSSSSSADSYRVGLGHVPQLDLVCAVATDSHNRPVAIAEPYDSSLPTSDVRLGIIDRLSASADVGAVTTALLERLERASVISSRSNLGLIVELETCGDCLPAVQTAVNDLAEAERTVLVIGAGHELYMLESAA